MPLLTSALALSCLVLTLIPQAEQLALTRQAILAGELWRLWTGHLVHFSSSQLYLDTAILLLLGTVAERELGSRFAGVLVLLGMPILAFLLLLLAPNLLEYRGASGVVMLLAGATGTVLWQRLPPVRGLLLFLVAALASKAIVDATGMDTTLTSLPSGVRVAWQAHVCGAVLGWLAACCKLRYSARAVSLARASASQGALSVTRLSSIANGQGRSPRNHQAIIDV